MDIAELEQESAELLPDREALCCWNYSWHSWNQWQGWNNCHSGWGWHGCGN